jgi:hypothetical protein
MTKIDIIQETADFYSADTTRRSFLNGKCVFNGENGTHCAIGRCMLPLHQENGSFLLGNTKSLISVIRLNHADKVNDPINIDHTLHDLVLQEKYRGHNYMFWRDLQGLHDTSDNWDEKGLTLIGETAVKELKRIYEHLN